MSNKNQGANKSAAPAPAPAPAAAPTDNAAEQSQQASEQASATGEGTAAPEGELLGQATITPASITGLTGASGSLSDNNAPVGDAKDPTSTRPPLPQTGPAAAPTGVAGGKAQELIENLRGNSEVYNAFAEIGQYLKDMAPGINHDEDKGGQNQTRLYGAIQIIAERSGDSFPKAWGALLALFHENVNGALGAKAFRFMNTIPLRPNDRQAYMRLINLIQHTADPKGREEAVKLTDFPRSLEFGLSQDARNRILGFYNK